MHVNHAISLLAVQRRHTLSSCSGFFFFFVFFSFLRRIPLSEFKQFFISLSSIITDTCYCLARNPSDVFIAPPKSTSEGGPVSGNLLQLPPPPLPLPSPSPSGAAAVSQKTRLSFTPIWCQCVAASVSVSQEMESQLVSLLPPPPPRKVTATKKPT